MKFVFVFVTAAVVVGCGGGEASGPKSSGASGVGVSVPAPHVKNISFCMQPGDDRVHMTGCPHATEGCAQVSFDEAMERGGKFCETCEPEKKYLVRAFGPYPEKPVRVEDEHTACGGDDDCALAPGAPCGCDPCGFEWREARNKERVKWLEARYAEESCNPAAYEGCEPCEVKHMQALPYLLGSVARCVDGHCEVFEK